MTREEAWDFCANIIRMNFICSMAQIVEQTMMYFAGKIRL